MYLPYATTRAPIKETGFHFELYDYARLKRLV